LRVLALAPTSEVAYRIELLRAISTGDHAMAESSARRALEDDIEDRRFAYAGAVQYLMRKAATDGTVDALSAWLDERAPGILDVDAPLVPGKFRAAQGVSFDAWFVSLPREEVLRRLDTMLAFGESVGFKLTQVPRTHMSVLALQGDIAKATEVALAEVLAQPVSVNLAWREDFAQAQFTEVLADPEVQSALQHWEDEEARLRETVRAYFADLSSVS